VALKHHNPLRKFVVLGSPRRCILWAWDMSAVTIHRKLMQVNSNDANTLATGCQIMQHICMWQGKCDGWQSGW